MEQGSMERQSRLPLAPSRLPLGGGGGPKIQMASATVHSGSGLPRLFNRPPQGPSPAPCETMNNLSSVPPPLVQQHPEEELTMEEQEWKAWVGKKVCISGIKIGTLMYFGTTSFAEGLFCGISLDEPEGRHDGELKGRRYFNCPADHGVFAPLSKVEKVLTSRLPPICSPIFPTDEVNRTFSVEKLSSEVLNQTFNTGKYRYSFGLNDTFLPAKTPSPEGGMNETFVHAKTTASSTFSLSGKSHDFDRMLQLAASPGQQRSFAQPHHHHYQNHQNHGHVSSPQHDGCYYDEDESSLGLLTDSQMGDFSIEGQLLMPKTQSCDDIHDLPEEEVVQDITVEYLEEPSPLETRFPYQQSTPMDLRSGKFFPDTSTVDEGSFSLIADQELPSCAFDASLCTLTEGLTNPASDEISQQCAASEMPEEVAPITNYFKDPSPTLVSNDIVNNGPLSLKPEFNISSSCAVRSAFVDGASNFSSKSVDPALVNRISANAVLPEELFSKTFSGMSEASVKHQEGGCSPLDYRSTNEHMTEVKLRDKGQRSLETSLTKSVEWNDVVMVQSGEDCKEERLSIEKVMEVIQAKGVNGQRPTSTYTVGSADTGYQGDAEFDMQSEIETASPCEEMKQLVSSSVCTSLSMDDAPNGNNNNTKMGKSGHLSDSDFFTEDPGEAEGDCSPDADAAEGTEVTMIAAGAKDPVDVTGASAELTAGEEEGKEAEVSEQVATNSSCNSHAEPEEPTEHHGSECGTLKKKKRVPLPPPPPLKKIVGVSKIKFLLESQPSTDQPKRARTPRKSRWDAVTLKIQANMEEDKVKPKREVRGRVNTNLVAARATPAPTAQIKKPDPLALGRLGGSAPTAAEGSGSPGPGSTRSTPVTESLNLLVDGDDTASQATTSARGTSPSLASTSSRCLGVVPLSTSSSSLSSIPSTYQQQHLQNKDGGRLPSKIAVRLHPRLEPVATVCEPAKRTGGARASARGGTVPKPPSRTAQNAKVVAQVPVLPINQKSSSQLGCKPKVTFVQPDARSSNKVNVPKKNIPVVRTRKEAAQGQS